MKRTTLLTLALACGAVFAAPKADLAKGKQIAQTVCAACHAADGNSGISSYPKLSAQHAAYIIKETVAIKDGKRTTGGAAAMRPMVGSLSAQDIADVAAFYATQTPKPGEANPKDNLDLGAKIFRGGLSEKKLPACMACHGPTGAGIEPAAFPRISGQHAKYTRTQLDAFRTSALIDQQASETDRASLVVRANDPNGMMRDVAEKLTPKQIEAVARYMQGLH